MITIPTNKKYLYYKIEIDNVPENPSLPEDYVLVFPHSYDSNRTYKSIVIEAVKSTEFSGNIKAELRSVITDESQAEYEKPVLAMQIDNNALVTDTIDVNTAGTYKLLDTLIEKLIVRVSQVEQGAGKIIFVLRGI